MPTYEDKEGRTYGAHVEKGLTDTGPARVAPEASFQGPGGLAGASRRQSMARAIGDAKAKAAASRPERERRVAAMRGRVGFLAGLRGK